MKKTIWVIIMLFLAVLSLTACTSESPDIQAKKEETTAVQEFTDPVHPENNDQNDLKNIDLYNDDPGINVRENTEPKSTDIKVDDLQIIEAETNLSELHDAGNDVKELTLDDSKPEISAPDITIEPQTDEEEFSGYLEGKVVSEGILGKDYPMISSYGPRDDYGGQISANHKGIDYAMDIGTKLIVPYDCTAVYTGFNQARGYWVVLYIGNGIYVEYQHLSSISVETGNNLKEGQIVGYSGETGESIVPHLHLEILVSRNGMNDISDFNDNSTRIDPFWLVHGPEA